MDVVILSSGPSSPTGTQFAYRYIGPYKIAHACRSAGYDVQVIDFINFLTEAQVYDFASRWIADRTAILALSTTFLLYKVQAGGASKGNTSLWPPHILAAVRRLKQDHPKLLVVLGGYNSNIADGHGIVDAAILNYGEDIFLELLEHVILGTDEPEHQAIVVNDQGETRKIYHKARRQRHNIQSDDHLFTRQDCIVPGETLPLEISRGCIFTCKFCHHLLLGRGKLDYLRSFDCIRAELVHNHTAWGVSNYYVICDTFNDTLEKMHRWHAMVTSLPFRIGYTCYLRADLLERFPEQAYILRETGLHSTFHGLESLGAEASYTVGKAWSGKKAREYIPRLYHDIWQAEIAQFSGFIIGLPGDTREMITDTISWFRDNDLYGIILEPLTLSKYKHVLASFSEFERHHEKYGYRFETDLDNWMLPYWDRRQAIDFHTTTVRPTIDPINAWYTSWQVMALESLGLRREYPRLFDKSWQRTQDFPAMKQVITDRVAQFIAAYCRRLAAL
jgi:hypothetical protein